MVCATRERLLKAATSGFQQGPWTAGLKVRRPCGVNTGASDTGPAA